MMAFSLFGRPPPLKEFKVELGSFMNPHARFPNIASLPVDKRQADLAELVEASEKAEAKSQRTGKPCYIIDWGYPGYKGRYTAQLQRPSRKSGGMILGVKRG